LEANLLAVLSLLVQVGEGMCLTKLCADSSRHLVWGQPVHVTPLSSVTISPERSVHRFELNYGANGEDVVITLTMEQQDSLTGQ
jgi:hypothetical protein